MSPGSNKLEACTYLCSGELWGLQRGEEKRKSSWELSDVSSEQDLGNEGVVQPFLDFFLISYQKRHELNQLFGMGRFGLDIWSSLISSASFILQCTFDMLSTYLNEHF